MRKFLSQWWRQPDPHRTMKLQLEVDSEWVRGLASQPGCEGLFSCVQCGTCSGSCPVSMYMDIGPRRVIGLVREGFQKDALTSRTIWLCASCYLCDVECPAQVRLTDLMAALKREAIRRRLFPREFPIPVLEKELCQAISQGGSRSQFWPSFRMALRSHPLQLFTLAATCWRLSWDGRLHRGRPHVARHAPGPIHPV